MKDLRDLVRPNILALEPYSCARDEFKGQRASMRTRVPITLPTTVIRLPCTRTCA